MGCPPCNEKPRERFSRRHADATLPLTTHLRDPVVARRLIWVRSQTEHANELHVLGSAATWAAPSGLHTTQRCNAIWVEWAAVSSSQGAGCGASGSMMASSAVPISGVSSSFHNVFVCLEVCAPSALTRRVRWLIRSMMVLNVCRASRVVRLGIVVCTCCLMHGRLRMGVVNGL